MNPDEYLNCDLKQGMSAIKALGNKETLTRNVRKYMKMLQDNTERVKKYFRHKSISYAA